MKNLLLIAGITVALAACGSKANTKRNLMSGETIAVKLMPVNTDTSASGILTSGLLSTEDEARLSFKIGGVIDKVLVKEGQSVKKGQLLATLKPGEISAQVGQVQLGLEKAQRDYQRIANLYRDSVATLEQLQNAKTGVEMAQRNLQQVNFNNQYSRINAVSDGFVVKQILHEGELANPGSPVLYLSSVSKSSPWILKAGVADREWAAIEKGNSAEVTIDAFPGESFRAIVSKKALAADPVSGSFEIELTVDFGKFRPAIGMFGKARITPTVKNIGYSIPYDALLEANGREGYVFVTDDRKNVKRIPVKVTGMDNKQVYISNGLENYQYVVICGSAYLNEHSQISVIQ